MVKKIKLIALDIDGTIIGRDYTISDEVKRAVKKASDMGIKVVLATGRMYESTVPYARELQLRTPVICYQGGLVKEFYDSEKTLLHHTIPYETAKEVIKELKNYGVQTNIYLDDKLYAENVSPILEEYCEKRYIDYHKVSNLFDKDSFEPLKIKVTKILALDYDVKLVDRIRDELRQKFGNTLNITKSTPNFCEFVNNKCSKANALMLLAKIWEIENDEIMAIGDQDNDRDMLKIAGYAVAMGNAENSLKDIADFVTDSVENYGAAKAIELLLTKD